MALAGFIRCQSELEVSKLRVTHGQTRNLNDIQVQFRNAVCIGFYGDDIACFRPIKFPQNAGDPNAVSNVEAMIHSPNPRDIRYGSAGEIVFSGFSLNPFDRPVYELLAKHHNAAKTIDARVVAPHASALLSRYRAIYDDRVTAFDVSWKEYLETETQEG